MLYKEGVIDVGQSLAYTHGCTDKTCEATSAAFLRENTKKEILDLVVLREFPLTPQLYRGELAFLCSELPSKERIATSLRALNVPICRHVRLHMPVVAATYNPFCHKFQAFDKEGYHQDDVLYQCKCSTTFKQDVESKKMFKLGTGLWKHYHLCIACESAGVITAVAFKTMIQNLSHSRKEYLTWPVLDIRIVLGPVCCHNSRTWLWHASDPQECQESRMQWRLHLDRLQEEEEAMFRRLDYQREGSIGRRTLEPTLEPIEHGRCSIM